jgi:hypothetical protein
MSARIDVAGHRFGRWLVVDYAGESKWNCTCDCGTQKAIHGSSLRRGQTMGCIKCHPALGKNRTHGGRQSRLYNIWTGMKARCCNPNEPAFENYGGRGISVCPEWVSCLEAFRDWALANGYQAHLTVERRDNDGNYEPSNCSWVTLASQKMNRRNTIKVVWCGRAMTLLDLAAETGVNYDLLKQRICKYRWPVDRAVSEPSRSPGKRKRVSFEVHRGNIDQKQETV